MKITIDKKIGLLLLIMAATAVINVTVVYQFLSSQRYDSHIINIAGRQRMFAQKLARFTLYVSYSDREDILSAIEFYNFSLDKLQNGGEIDGFIIPPAPRSMDAIFKKTWDIWLPIKLSINKLLDDIEIKKGSDETIKDSAAKINSKIDDLLDISNEITFSFEGIFMDKTIYLKRLMIIMLAINVFVIFLGWFLVNSDIVKPLKYLSKTVSKIGSGDLDQEIKILKTNDEIEDLAISFNQMLRDLQDTTVSKKYVDNIIGSMLNSLLVLDIDGNIHQVNAATLTLLGYREDELLGQPLKKILSNGTYLDEFLNNSIKKDSLYCAAQINEQDYLTRNGKKIPVLFSYSTILDVHDEIQWIVCVAQDIRDLKKATETIKNDINAAAVMQKKLLPPPTIIGKYRFEWIFNPSSYLGGDIFNYFKLDERHLGLYLIDVTGHGLPAALLSFNLSKTIASFPIEISPLKKIIPIEPYYEILSPSLAAQEINKRFQRQEGTMQYFTMVYAMIDTQSDRLKLLRAGHAMPIFLPKNSQPILIEKGGLPVGMLPDVKYDNDVEEILFNKGDRLFIYSDGITDCVNKYAQQFTEERLIKFIEDNREASLNQMMVDLKHTLIEWRGDSDFSDDVTMLAIERSYV